MGSQHLNPQLPPPPALHANLLDALAKAPLLVKYSEAFTKATGVTLGLSLWDKTAKSATDLRAKVESATYEQLLTPEGASKQNPLCAEISSKIKTLGPDEATALRNCFGAFSTASVPVFFHKEAFAKLTTSGVLTTSPEAKALTQMEKVLDLCDLSKSTIAAINKVCSKIPALPKAKFEGLSELLVFFAKQLSALSEEIAIAIENAEPEAVLRARAFVRSHLDQQLSLAVVSQYVGFSPSHFSRMFKTTSGISLTEFIARSRIESAQRALLRPNARITEIAFRVGFQSLSQFNRCFTKVYGESPTMMRRRLLTQAFPKGKRRS